MSLFKWSDYGKKKETIHKTKLPTEFKTKKHKCSQCTRNDAVLYPITENEKRWLCPIHIEKFNNQYKKENSVNFVKASKLTSRRNGSMTKGRNEK